MLIYILKIEIMTRTKLTVNNNGSVKVEGDFEIVDMQGQVYGLQGRTLVSLCRCGRSNNKPFCDGSHKGTGLQPVKYEVAEKKTVWWCQCKHTANPPLCDGSHKRLPQPGSAAEPSAQ